MAEEPTRDELYEQAKALDIEGRSDMNKDELAAAVEQAQAEQSGGANAPAEPAPHPQAGEPTPATNDQGPAQPQVEVDPTSAGNTATNPQQDVNIQGEVATSGAESVSPTQGDTGYTNRPA